MEGVINERRFYRHVQIDTTPPIEPTKAADVELIKDAKGKVPEGDDIDISTATLKEVTRRYYGATVRIKEGNENAGVEGAVSKVIWGDWYVTYYRVDSNEQVEG